MPVCGQAQAAPLCGFLNVLKPPGISSAQVVGRVRRLLGGEKVGHAGTLDPEAAGVLPLMVGKAARLFDYLQDKRKAYIAEAAFGCATDTQDAQGVAVAWSQAYPSEQAIRGALPAFIGEGLQTPPMYSALKRDGRPLYQLARQGCTLALEPRPITVYECKLLGVMPRRGALLYVECAKGLYVRTLCHDLGLALGCPAHMRFLLRTLSGAFTLAQACTLEELETSAAQGSLASSLTAADAPLMHLPAADVPARLSSPFCNGVPLRADASLALEALPEGKPARLYLRGSFVAVGERVGNTVTTRTWLGA